MLLLSYLYTFILTMSDCILIINIKRLRGSLWGKITPQQNLEKAVTKMFDHNNFWNWYSYFILFHIQLLVIVNGFTVVYLNCFWFVSSDIRSHLGKYYYRIGVLENWYRLPLSFKVIPKSCLSGSRFISWLSYSYTRFLY